jgi:hypothetical protein
MSPGSRIGFDRTIHSEWLDVAVASVMRRESSETTRKLLWNFLEGVELGTTNNSGRGKTLTVLTRVWVSVPAELSPLRDAALKSIKAASSEQRICIHWAMTAATHRFFFDVASSVGRLLKLHGSANRSQVKRRMTDAWGDRSTLERTIQHVLRSLDQWELLRNGPEHGSLTGPARRIEADEKISQLLLHAVLLAQGKAGSFSQLTNHPALFPFTLNLSRKSLSENPLFLMHRQGDQSELIELRNPPNGPTKWMAVA